MLPPPPRSTLFPYTTLFRSTNVAVPSAEVIDILHNGPFVPGTNTNPLTQLMLGGRTQIQAMADRKSTRLNSSHPSISYAVFCLKKKKQKTTQRTPPISQMTY